MKHKVVCIGAMLVDELFFCKEPVVAGTSNPAHIKRTAGGVMRNIVQHLQLLDIPVQFITVVGNDADGEWLKSECRNIGIDTSTTITASCSTGKYAAILQPDGNLYTAVAVNPAEAYLSVSVLQEYEEVLGSATIIIADTNLDAKVIEWLIKWCKEKNILCCIEPVSVAKARKLSNISLDGLYMVTPNEDELPSLSVNRTDENSALQELLQRGVQHIWLRKGAAGSAIASANGIYSLPSPKVEVKDITGAGDAALAAWIVAFSLGKTEMQCLETAHTMAAIVLQTKGAIVSDISQEKLFSTIKNYYPDAV